MKRIIVKGLSKTFKIGVKRKQTALARIVSFISDRGQKRAFKVLKDVSFSANKGEIIGIIGRNGSGKSTLLRIISGIIEKDKGFIETHGKIISIINLYNGLKERLTMRDNIHLCCSYFGLGQKEIKKTFKSIVEFTELEAFVNIKLYQFSEGMKQRLVFSVAIHANPEILLLDEAFTVGDQQFRFKCINKINELLKKDCTILFVSHEIWFMEKYCPKLIWIDNGSIKMQGKTNKVLKAYLEASTKN